MCIHLKNFYPNAALLIVALLCFFGLYEIYPQPGWVDASMYFGYAINPEIYKAYPFALHNYQGSRLGYILPQFFILRIIGETNGREIYVLILYLAYFFSVITLTGFFIKKNVERTLLSVLFIFNPGFISSIFYGGADGPAAVQLLVAISFLICASKSISPFIRNGFYFFSGFLLILSISSHIFVLIPALLIVPAFLYLLKVTKPTVAIIFGGLSAMFICTYYGYQFGLDRFYFLYSLPFVKFSLFSTVFRNAYDVPFAYWVKDSLAWLPVILSILFFFILNRNLSTLQGKQFPLLVVSLLNLIGPIIFFTLYDVFIGGNMLVTPSYFNIAYPCFLVGLVLMFSLAIETTGGNDVINISKTYQTRTALVFLVCGSLILTFSANHTRGLFPWNSVKSIDLHRSEILFMERFRSYGINARKNQIIYTASEPVSERDPRVYKLTFRGSRQYYDYMDSLTGLFLWDRSTAARLKPNTDFKKVNLKLNKDIPIIVLGRSKAEVRKLVIPLSRFLIRYTAGPYECFDDNSYPWCFIEFRKSENLIQMSKR